MTVVVLTATAVAFFLAIHSVYPVLLIDYTFYIRLYASIGIASGIAASYVRYLVSNARVSLGSIAMLLVMPYCFVVFLAIDVNPPVAALATLMFGFILIAGCLGRSTLTRRVSADNHAVHRSGGNPFSDG
ncbi:hypothetical protein [Crateriforma spongiae]|uniref:hypothetical protein n=1 Tax=Crateriforma spongiae TaxID=2724528 RepID=UPI0039AF6D8D